jgi:Rrf2 family iron-sulfur cluster assembly transcriptional regulator
MAMTDLAAQGEGVCSSLADISVRQNISVTFLEQLFNKLRRAELVLSVRGAKGGYILNATAETLTLDHIIHAVDENIKAHGCEPEDRLGCTGRTSRCLTHNLWGALEDHIELFLASVTLQDVVEGRLPLSAVKTQNLEAAE